MKSKRTEQINIRLSEKELLLVKRAALIGGNNVSDYFRCSVIEKSKRTVRKGRANTGDALEDARRMVRDMELR